MQTTEHARERWARLRIHGIEERAESAGGGMTRVEARIHLGELVPADVCVELVAGEDLGRVPADHRSCRRLCSVQSYDNGTYLFEVSVPTADLSLPVGYAVRVSPTSAFADAKDASPVVRWVASQGRDGARDHLLPRLTARARLAALLGAEATT